MRRAKEIYSKRTLTRGRWSWSWIPPQAWTEASPHTTRHCGDSMASKQHPCTTAAHFHQPYDRSRSGGSGRVRVPEEKPKMHRSSAKRGDEEKNKKN